VHDRYVRRPRDLPWRGYVVRWEEVRRRHAAGQSISQIARALGKERKTIRRYLTRPVPWATPRVVVARQSHKVRKNQD
jgi:IS30 family transposase